MHHAIYEMLLDNAAIAIDVETLQVGVHWLYCDTGHPGIAPTPAGFKRSWQTSPVGQDVRSVSRWLLDWDASRSAVAMAVINSVINREADMVSRHGGLFRGHGALQGGFDWFARRIAPSERVALISERHCPVSPAFSECTRIAHQPGVIAVEAEMLLPHSDWVFLPATTISDKTLPRYLALAADSRVVLYGSGLPWLEEWHGFGIDYLFGGQIEQPAALHQAVSEGADVETMAAQLGYRVVEFGAPANVEPLVKERGSVQGPGIRLAAGGRHVSGW